MKENKKPKFRFGLKSKALTPLFIASIILMTLLSSEICPFTTFQCVCLYSTIMCLIIYKVDIYLQLALKFWVLIADTLIGRYIAWISLLINSILKLYFPKTLLNAQMLTFFIVIFSFAWFGFTVKDFSYLDDAFCKVPRNILLGFIWLPYFITLFRALFFTRQLSILLGLKNRASSLQSKVLVSLRKGSALKIQKKLLVRKRHTFLKRLFYSRKIFIDLPANNVVPDLSLDNKTLIKIQTHEEKCYYTNTDPLEHILVRLNVSPFKKESIRPIPVFGALSLWAASFDYKVFLYKDYLKTALEKRITSINWRIERAKEDMNLDLEWETIQLPALLKISQYLTKCQDDLSFNLDHIASTTGFNSLSVLNKLDTEGLSCLEVKGFVLEHMLTMITEYTNVRQKGKLRFEEWSEKLESLSSLEGKELIKEIIRQKDFGLGIWDPVDKKALLQINDDISGLTDLYIEERSEMFDLFVNMSLELISNFFIDPSTGAITVKGSLLFLSVSLFFLYREIKFVLEERKNK